jgi:hypothetical protein
MRGDAKLESDAYFRTLLKKNELATDAAFENRSLTVDGRTRLFDEHLFGRN